MRVRKPIWVAACAVAAALAAASNAVAAETRYSLAGGCFALRAPDGKFAAKADGGGYGATAPGAATAELFRTQAADLGRYLLYGKAGDFLSGGAEVAATAQPDEQTVWTVEGDDPFTLRTGGTGLAVGDGGRLVSSDEPDRFTFVRAEGCAVYPEITTNVDGAPSKGATPYGEVAGFLDAHLHMMAFEFLGGSAHCGRPWHRFGVAHALVDCPDHSGNGAGALLDNVLYGDPARTHDTVGWPTFKDWPHHKSLTHEAVYYKWMERAWRGGLRMFVNLLVDNAVLCEIYPIKRNSCNEMQTIRLQLEDMYELQDYIDAQSGGPGKGFFRIVRSPFEAREVINGGKLAVVLGIETSKLFDCGEFNDKPECDRAQVDRFLDEFHRLGVRGMQLVNKFDNALSGVAGDEGALGVAINTANKYETGHYWKMDTCTSPGHDKPQVSAPGMDRDALVGAAFQMFLPPDAAPVYGPPPHCNQRGLTELGEYLIRQMMKKGMIVDPDHQSQLGRNHTLSLIEAEDYSGVVSSHSWSTEVDYPRIYRSGGVVTPYAGDSTSFVDAWRQLSALPRGQWYWGIGYGADTNGFGPQGGPREDADRNPVTYPFKSFDGRQTIKQQRSGERVYDINKDGVAHYGLYPDWIEDLRKIAGDQIVKDMARGPEAYLQMWERAMGVPGPGCRSGRGKLTSRGLFKVHLDLGPEALLRRAGQPQERPGRAWRWCVQGERNKGRHVSAVFTPGWKVGLVGTDALGHRALRVEVGAAVRSVVGARAFGRGLMVRDLDDKRRLVYRIRGDRVRAVAVASRGAARSPRVLRRYLALAGLL